MTVSGADARNRSISCGRLYNVAWGVSRPPSPASVPRMQDSPTESNVAERQATLISSSN